MATHIVWAIALCPSGNAQGGHYFLILQTGLSISRNHWTMVFMPADGIKLVEKMAKSQVIKV